METLNHIWVDLVIIWAEVAISIYPEAVAVLLCNCLAFVLPHIMPLYLTGSAVLWQISSSTTDFVVYLVLGV